MCINFTNYNMKKHFIILILASTFLLSHNASAQTTDSAAILKSQKRIDSDMKDAAKRQEKIDKSQKKIAKEQKKIERQDKKRAKEMKKAEKEQKKINNG